MNHEEIKSYFETNPPPKQVQWTPWANINDTQVFLRSCYIGILNFNGPVDRRPAWGHLRDFYILLKKTVPQTTVEKTAEAAPEQSASEVAAQEENAI